ncbi:Hypothetical predicted protein, partial [Pelobates cultripes]
TIEFLQKDILEIENEITRIQHQLSTMMSLENLNALNNKLNREIEQYELEVEQRKRLKFIRDAEDYANNRVYKWTNERNREYPHKRRVTWQSRRDTYTTRRSSALAMDQQKSQGREKRDVVNHDRSTRLKVRLNPDREKKT